MGKFIKLEFIEWNHKMPICKKEFQNLDSNKVKYYNREM